jgi:nucleotide-binding universal stress UspA family protein
MRFELVPQELRPESENSAPLQNENRKTLLERDLLSLVRHAQTHLDGSGLHDDCAARDRTTSCRAGRSPSEERAMNVSKIVVGIDGSPRQARVVNAAAELAVRFGAQLILVRVANVPAEIPAEAWQCAGINPQRFFEQHASPDLAAAAELLPEALRRTARLETIVATPWQGLCTVAEGCGADLLVIGSHGYGGLDYVLGTTAARVVNHAPCSVFVVRAGVSQAVH